MPINSKSSDGGSISKALYRLGISHYEKLSDEVDCDKFISFRTLSSLPNLVLQDLNCMDEPKTDGKEIAQYILKGGKLDYDEFCKKDNLFSYAYEIQIKLETAESRQPYRKVNLKLFHLMILLRRRKFLQHMLKVAGFESFLTEPIGIHPKEFVPCGKDSWIFGGNSVHFAARFFPEGLNLILSQVDDKEYLINACLSEKKWSPLHVAVLGHDSLSTKILLHHGQSNLKDVEDDRGYTPLFFATHAGSLSNMIELIDHGANVNHVAKNADNLPHPNVEGDLIDEKTPLFKARSYETVKLLLDNGAKPNKLAFIQPHIQPFNTTFTSKRPSSNIKISAVEHLMKYNPDCAKAILDSCILMQEDGDLIIDLSIFQKKENGNDYLDDEVSLLIAAEKQSSMSFDGDQERSPILLHPLLQIFLSLKFKSVGLMFLFELIFYIILVMLLTKIGIEYVELTSCEMIENQDDCFTNKYGIEGCHVMKEEKKTIQQQCNESMISLILQGISEKQDFMKEKLFLNLSTINNRNFSMKCDKNNFRSTTEDDSLAPLELICLATGYDSTEDCWTQRQIYIWTMTYLVIVFLKPLLEIVAKGLKSHFTCLENYIEMLLQCAAWTFIILSRTDVELALHACAWMIFFAWIDLTLYLGKFHIIGKYVFMSIHVSKTIILCLLAYTPCLFAYSFGFYVLLHSNPTFSGYVRSFIEVVVMMVDDLDYPDFEFNEVNNTGGRNYSIQIMFVLFMISMSILIMNLLVTVAVNNTENLAERSELMLSRRKTSFLEEFTSYKKKIIVKQLFDILEMCKIQIGESILRSLSGRNNYKVFIKNSDEYSSFDLWNLGKSKNLCYYNDGNTRFPSKLVDENGKQMKTPLINFMNALKYVRHLQEEKSDFIRKISEIRNQSKSQLNMICKLEDAEEETEQEKSHQKIDEASQEYIEIKKELEVLKTMILEILSSKKSEIPVSTEVCESIEPAVVSMDDSEDIEQATVTSDEIFPGFIPM